VAPVSADRSGYSGIMTPTAHGTDAGAASSIVEGGSVLRRDTAFQGLVEQHSAPPAGNPTTPAPDKAMTAEFLTVLDSAATTFTFQVFGEAHRPLRAKCSQAPVGELVQAFASDGQRSSLGRLESITLKVSPSSANIRANTLAGSNSSGLS
jgi:hypothetical protein